MKVLIFCPIWGSKDIPFGDFLKKVKHAGFDGVELSLPLDNEERGDIISAIRNADLLFIGQHWETVTLNFDEHKKEFISRLYNLASGDPLLIDSQTGKDFFSFEQNMELIEAASAFTKDSNILVVHETHRGKFSFAAHITKKFIESNPDLRIGADFSHWCNVAESLLDNQSEALDIAISRTDHIHARVGFQEGPQIPDPRAPEWKEVLEKHISWWDRIISRAESENREFFTITPEFGPYPYMTILPHTREPISNQWDVNVYMMNLLKERYNDARKNRLTWS
jgi:sugar phosphate isomerase/epimerase